MATTTNYGWTTPDDTALVKDGAAAIRTLGSSVDTTTKNLNPETTLGDIAYRSSTANVKTRLGIGSTGNVLTVAGGVPSWAAPATPSSGLTLINRSTFSAVTSHTVDSVFSSTYKSYVIVLEKCAGSANALEFQFRYGSTTETGSVYYYYTAKGLFNNTTIAAGLAGSAVANIQFADNSGAALYPTHSTINVFNVGNTAEYATINYLGNNGGGSPGWNSGSGSCWSSQTMTGFLIKATNNIAGSVSVYGLGI